MPKFTQSTGRDFIRGSGITLIIFCMTYPFFGFFLLKGSYVVAFSGFVLVFIGDLYFKQNKFWLPSYLWPIVLLFSFAPISILWSMDPKATAYGSLVMLLNIILFYLAAHSTKGGRQYVIWLLGHTVPILMAIILVCIYVKFGLPRELKGEIKDVVGSFSNQAWGVSIVTLPLLIANFRVKRISVALTVIAVLACALTVFISQSRMAFFIFFLAVFFSVWCSPGKILMKAIRTFSYAVAAMLIGGVLVLALGYDATIGTVKGRFEQSQLSANFLSEPPQVGLKDYARISIYQSGLQAILERPVTGIGYKTLKPYMEDKLGFGYASHNIVITFWAEMGLGAFLLFIWISYRYFFGMLSITFSTYVSQESRYLAGALGAPMVLILVSSLTRPLEGNYMYPILLGFLATIWAERPYPNLYASSGGRGLAKT